MGLSGLFHLVPDTIQIIAVTINPGPFFVQLVPGLETPQGA